MQPHMWEVAVCGLFVFPYQFRQLQEIAEGTVKEPELLSMTCAMHLISLQVLPFLIWQEGANFYQD